MPVIKIDNKKGSNSFSRTNNLKFKIVSFKFECTSLREMLVLSTRRESMFK